MTFVSFVKLYNSLVLPRHVLALLVLDWVHLVSKAK